MESTNLIDKNYNDNLCNQLTPTLQQQRTTYIFPNKQL